MKTIRLIIALISLTATNVMADEYAEAAKITRAKVSCEASTVRFRDGDIANPNFNSDRGTYLKVPEKYSGWKATYPKEKGDPLEFEVEKAGIVIVMIPKGMSADLLADGWKKVGTVYVDWRKDDDEDYDAGENALRNVTVTILEKHLDVGKHEIRATGNVAWPRLLMKR